jgi:hypothetical protein
MKDSTEHVIRELTVQLESLRLQVAGTEQALAALRTDHKVAAPVLRRTKSQFLREHLRDHPEGVRVSRVNEVIAARGYKTRFANSQYNWVYQDRDAKQSFIITEGVVRLRSEAPESNAQNRVAVEAAAHRANSDPGGTQGHDADHQPLRGL